MAEWRLRLPLLGGAARRGARVGDPSPGEDAPPTGADSVVAHTVRTDDGVDLRVEVCGRSVPAPTVVFIPGFCLTTDCWYRQRRDLAGQARLVFYDQRGHGRSGRGPAENSTIEQLVRDLRAVLDQVAGEGPIVLVGHSLGGMVVMGFAGAYPELVGSRIVGAGLIATSPGRLAEMTLGLPAVVMRRVWPRAPRLVERVAARPRLHRRLRADTDLGRVITRRLAFGDPTVSAATVRFTAAMLASTPIEVFAEFFGEFDRHDTESALPALRGCQTVIIGGERDRLTPAEHSRTIAAALPDAELIVVPGCGHLIPLEAAEMVTAALRRLMTRAGLVPGERATG